MFDVYEINHGPSSVSVDITEKRAPTDESVRLLREMEEKARQQVKAAIRIEDTSFNCVVHVYHDHLSDVMRLSAIFSLNGKKMQAEYGCPSFSANAEDAVIGLRDAVATKIADHIAGAFKPDQQRELRRVLGK